MLTEGLHKARTAGLLDGLLDAGALLGVGRGAADGFEPPEPRAHPAQSMRRESR